MPPEINKLVHLNSQESSGLHALSRTVIYFNNNKFKVASIYVWTKDYKVCLV